MSQYRNIVKTGWAYLAPLIVALASVPWLLQRLGSQSVGILSMVWALIGYMGLLELGASRVLARRVAQLHLQPAQATHAVRAVHHVLWLITGLASLMLSAIPVGQVMRAFDITTLHQSQAHLVWLVSLICIPFTVAANALRGAMEGAEDWIQANRLRLWQGITTYLLPAITALFTRDLHFIVLSLMLSRALFWWLAWRWFSSKLAVFDDKLSEPELWQKASSLLKEGGWMTVSSVVGPFMMYMDRFVVAALVGASSIAAYTVPQDLMSKLLIIPLAVATVTFPALSRANLDKSNTWKTGQALQAEQLALQAVFTLCLFVLASKAWVTPWLVGSALAMDANSVLRWLCCGLMFNSAAQFPFNQLQADGRSKWIAWVHMGELFPYLGLIWILVDRLGMMGASIAWAIRSAIDYLLLQWLSSRAQLSDRNTLRRLSMILIIVMSILVTLDQGLTASSAIYNFWVAVLFFGGLLISLSLAHRILHNSESPLR